MTKDVLSAFRPNQKAATKPLHYTMSGLDNVWLMNGFHEEQTPYGHGVRVEDSDSLARVIAQVIVSDKAPMSGKELRFVRKLMHLSQNGLSRLLGCSDQRLARWEKGRQDMDPTAERLTRMIVRGFLGEDCNIMTALGDLAEMDEALHGGHHLTWDAGKWKRAA